MRAFAIDDTIQNLNPLSEIFDRLGISFSPTNDGDIFQKYMQESKPDDILISDYIMPGIVLSGMRYTQDDAGSGFVLLDTSYSKLGALAGMRVLVSVHKIKDAINRKISRISQAGKKFIYLNSSSENFLTDLQSQVESFAYSSNKNRLMDLISKYDYARNIVNEWVDSEADRLAFFGKVAAGDLSPDQRQLVASGVFDQDIEDRCLAIYTIKRTLVAVFGEGNLSDERRWLNAKNPYLNHSSPIDLIRSLHQHAVYQILSVMRAH